MPTEHNAQGRRPHYNRGRRGPDRRGLDRRTTQQAQEQGRPQGGDHVDVEQIMRDIRARIAQRHGIELTSQQIQELAARRLEAVLDPRTLNPALIEQLRRGAGAPPEIAPPTPDHGYTFEDTTLYESHRGFLRFMRRLLNPLLKLFINPNPVIDAFKTQARLNREAAVREAERERRQMEWNALHYDILQRLVTEVSRASIEMQSVALRVDSLSAKVDYNDRRVRSFENSVPAGRQPPPPRAEHVPAAPVPITPGGAVSAEAGTTEAPTAEGVRRKRRRRRGRRSGGGIDGAAAPPAGDVASSDATVTDGSEGDDGDDGDEGDLADTTSPPPVVAGFVAPAAPPEAVEPSPEPVQPTPPRDEPSPAAPVDHADPGPPDR